MAGGQERILRRRIKSVESTKKITRAMELIAASRIVKAQARVYAAKPYSERITEVIRHMAAGGGEISSPLLEAPGEITGVGFLVLTADRGLCGGYNSSVIRLAERSIAEQTRLGHSTHLVVVGKKAQAYFRYREQPMAASFTGLSDQPSYAQAKEVAQAIAGAFYDGSVQTVHLVGTRFLSAGSQQATQEQIMPLALGDLIGTDATSEVAASYEFEPSPEEILDQLLPRYVEARIYAALLEASASELASRQRAMKAATDNAEELIKSLKRIMNRARQDSITTEIMEIVGGAEALRQGGKLVADDLLIDVVSSTDTFGHKFQPN